MELHQLRAFVTIAQEGSMTRAAELLFTSQPAVSAQLKSLEQELGVALFQRTSTGMKLTDEGQKLLGQARAILQQSRTFEDLSRHLRDGLAGTLRIGLNQPVKHLRIDELSSELVTAYPEMNLHFENGRSGTVIKGLKAFDLDVGFAEGAWDEDTSLRAVPLLDVHLRIVIPQAWSGEIPAGDWSALQQRPWVFVSPDCSHYRLIRGFCDEHRLELREQFRVDDDEAAIGLVSRGLAVSILMQPDAEAAEARGDGVIWQGFADKVTLHACALRKRAEERPIAAFFDACRAVFAGGMVGEA